MKTYGVAILLYHQACIYVQLIELQKHQKLFQMTSDQYVVALLTKFRPPNQCHNLVLLGQVRPML